MNGKGDAVVGKKIEIDEALGLFRFIHGFFGGLVQIKIPTISMDNLSSCPQDQSIFQGLQPDLRPKLTTSLTNVPRSQSGALTVPTRRNTDQACEAV